MSTANEPVFWRGPFNEWHIGLGGHINVKHYAQALDDARAMAALKQGDGPAELRERGFCTRPITDRIDFRKELAPGDAARIQGVTGRDQTGATALNGSMLAEPDGTLIMRYQTTFGLFDPASGDPVIWANAPSRKIDPLRALRPIPEPSMPARPPGNAWVTWTGTVEVGDSDHHGLISPRAIYDIITRGLWAVHIRLGRHRDGLKKTGGAERRNRAEGAVRQAGTHGRPAGMPNVVIGGGHKLLAHGPSDPQSGVRFNSGAGRVCEHFLQPRVGKKEPPGPDYLDGIMDIRLDVS